MDLLINIIGILGGIIIMMLFFKFLADKFLMELSQATGKNKHRA